MKRKLLYSFLIILMLSGILAGCTRTSNNTLKLKIYYEGQLFVNSTTDVRVMMSDGSFPPGKVTFISSDESIIKIEEELSNYSVKIKAIGIGTAKLRVEYKELKDEVNITIKAKYDSIGNGTMESPHQISEVEHLEQLFKNTSGNEGKYFKLMNNIVIEEKWYAPSLTGEAYPGHVFKGHFDGNGKTIEFLQGNGFLFGDNKGTIRNLKIKGQAVGAFIADTNSGEISNCLVEGSINVFDMSNIFGSIANYNTGTIKNCISKVDITANERTYAIGGVCGIFESGIIENCLFLGAITVNSAYNNGDSVGAIVGQRYTEEAILKNLYYDTSAISKNTKTNYFCPDRAVGCHKIGDTELSETENVTNVTGISDWQIASFLDFDSAYWDLSQDVPRLKSFL